MNARTFQAIPAVREQTPILFGITGASGGGKTYSALRAAIGICEILGGIPYFIDTDNRRALQYADAFRKADGSPGFKHVPFNPPFGSDDYVAAISYAEAQEDCGCIIVDSMSHEHQGIGGMIEFYEAEWKRMGGNDKTKMLAWSKPKAARTRLLLKIQRLNKPTIFCFRAKEGAKPVKGADGKTEVVQTGFVPIGGDEFVYEMTLNALLMPAAGGVPEWNPTEVGERRMTKLPEQFKSLRGSKIPIDEELGRNLAKWARGGVKRPAAPPPPETDLPPADGPETGQGDRTAADARRQASSGSEPGPGPDNRADPREERLAERGFSGEGLAPADDAFPGDRPQDPGAGTPGAQTQAPAKDAGPASTAQTQPSQDGASSASSPPDFGFVDLANALASGKEWADLIEALRRLTTGTTWKSADPAMKAKARAAVFMRLKELMKDGLRFDFTDDAHAFRCYIEFEPEGPTLRGNFGAFKLSPTYGRLSATGKGEFDKAMQDRLAIIEPADGAAAIEGDFN